mgnify:FL=1
MNMMDWVNGSPAGGTAPRVPRRRLFGTCPWHATQADACRKPLGGKLRVNGVQDGQNIAAEVQHNAADTGTGQREPVAAEM